jgi:hypothetical protein
MTACVIPVRESASFTDCLSAAHPSIQGLAGVGEPVSKDHRTNFALSFERSLRFGEALLVVGV